MGPEDFDVLARVLAFGEPKSLAPEPGHAEPVALAGLALEAVRIFVEMASAALGVVESDSHGSGV